MQCTLTVDPEHLCPCTLCHCLCVLVWAHLHTWGVAEVWGGCCKKMLSPLENGFGKLFSALCHLSAVPLSFWSALLCPLEPFTGVSGLSFPLCPKSEAPEQPCVDAQSPVGHPGKLEATKGAGRPQQKVLQAQGGCTAPLSLGGNCHL